MEIKGYLANLADYNNGNDHGMWIELPTDDETLEQVCEDLHIGEDGDEHIFLDWEGINLGENISLDEANEIALRVESLEPYEEDVLEALIDDRFDVERALDIIESGDYVLYSDCGTMADVAEEHVEESGALDGVPDWIARYIDYDALGRDLEMEGTFLECNNVIVEIFR